MLITVLPQSVPEKFSHKNNLTQLILLIKKLELNKYIPKIGKKQEKLIDHKKHKKTKFELKNFQKILTTSMKE